MRLVVIAACALMGCGDDIDASCQPMGFADGESVIAGAPMGPFVRAAQIEPPMARAGITHAIALDEVEGTCGEPGLSGRRIVILFCEKPAVGVYDITNELAFRCPSSDTSLSIVEDPTGLDIVHATDGTVDISYAKGCVTGSYELQFDTDTIAGSFDAKVCPPLDD